MSVLVVRVDTGIDGSDDMALKPKVDAPELPGSDPESSGRGTERLVDGRSRPGPEPQAPPPRFHRRGMVSAVLVLLILVAGFWVIASYARNNYYVGLEQDQVVIFQGRPGGVLWFDPTVERGAALVRDGLTPALGLEVEGNPQFGSLADAEQYIVELEVRATEALEIDPSTGDG